MSGMIPDYSILLNPKVPPCRGFVRNRDGRYSTVDFALDYSRFLMDKFEKNGQIEGLESFYDGGKDEEEYVFDGYIDFLAEINDKPGRRIELRIRYIAVPYGCPGNGKAGYIELTRREQFRLLKELDAQCRQDFGKSCKELLTEAHEIMVKRIRKMEEDES